MTRKELGPILTFHPEKGKDALDSHPPAASIIGGHILIPGMYIVRR